MNYSIFRFHDVGVRFYLAASVLLAACTPEPTPGDSTANASTSDHGDTTVDPSASSASTGGSSEGGSTGPGSTGPGSTGPGSTGPVSEPQPTDCDALRDQAACEALSGAEFECVWFPEAYPVTLEGSTCSVGAPIGWCIAAYTGGETGCVEDVSWVCMGGSSDVENLFVREGDDTTVLIQDMALEGIEFGCANPVLWEACNGSVEPAACECGCDPGLPE